MRQTAGNREIILNRVKLTQHGARWYAKRFQITKILVNVPTCRNDTGKFTRASVALLLIIQVNDLRKQTFNKDW